MQGNRRLRLSFCRYIKIRTTDIDQLIDMRRVIFGLPSVFEKVDCAIAVGNFDGVHRGHQALLEEVVEAARARGLMPAVLTFEPHPKEYFGMNNLVRISTLRDKVNAILACGIERVYIGRFNAQMAAMSPVEFARDYLSEGLACRWITVGENFSFGAKGVGTFETLEELGRHYHFEAYCTPLLYHGQTHISSSRIRAALELGDLFDVADMLGHRMYVTGRVVHGAALGRTLGFPTLNTPVIAPYSKAQFGLHGVFAVKVWGLTGANTPLLGVASVGLKPTVTDSRRWMLETHVFDWKGDAYGKLIKTEFVAKIRDEKKFSGLEELTAAIRDDAVKAREILGRSVADDMAATGSSIFGA